MTPARIEPLPRVASGQQAAKASAPARVRVWDLGVRLFHWSLVALVAAAAVTGFLGPRNWLDYHLIAGVGVGALVLFRLVWGWTGSTYARFASFAWPPRAMLARLAEIRAGRHRRYLGHNPLGAAMVFALLAIIAAIVLTGAVTLGGADKQGPFAAITSYATGGFVREIHQILAIGLLVLIGLHLAGVLFEARTTGENLVGAMVTGDKPAAPPAEVAPPVIARPLMALVVLAGIGLVAGPGLIALWRLPALGVPTAPIDASYAKECGSCHFAYPPSLAPAATWTAVMDNLENHFGENAIVDHDTDLRLRAYLAANSAEHWDSRVAVAMRSPNPDEPQRLTATRFWSRMHHEIPAAVFAAKAVGAKGACNACHADAATGRFDPQRIAIPKEATP